MEQLLIELIVIGVFVLIAIALLGYFGVVVNPLVWRIAGILIGGIILIFVIRLLWPLLVGGSIPGLG